MNISKFLIAIIIFLLSANSCRDEEKNSFMSVDELINEAKIFSHVRHAKVDSIFNYGMNLLNKAEMMDSNNFEIYYYKSFYYSNAKKYDSAILSLEKSLNLNPENPYALSFYARIYDYLGDTIKANEFYKKSLDVCYKLINSKAKEYIYADGIISTINILFGKDSALKYYNFIKNRHRIFDPDSSIKNNIIKIDRASSLKREFE